MKKASVLWIIALAFSLVMAGGNPVQPALASSGTVTQTSYTDFTQTGVIFSNTHVLDMGSGDASVVLAGAFADDFTDATLGSQWTSGLWGGGTAVYSIADSILTIPAGASTYVHSAAAFQQPTTTLATSIEFLADFGGGNDQHVGFGSLDFGSNRYILISTNGSTPGDLYARLNNNSTEDNADLGPIPTGMHRYRIDWLQDPTPYTDTAIFWKDGVQVATLSVTDTLDSKSLPPLYAYISNSSASGALSVDWLQVSPPYAASGTYNSSTLDAGAGNAFTTLGWSATTPTNTTLSVATSSSADDSIWSPYVSVTNGGNISNAARYLRYRLTFSTTDTSATPVVDSVSANYATATANLSITKQVSAATVDAGTDFNYTINVSNAGPGVASNVTVTDPLPAGLTYNGYTGGGWSCNEVGGTVTCTLSSLGVASATPLVLNVTAPADAATLKNTATVSSSSDPGGEKPSNEVDVTVNPVADLSLQKTADPSVVLPGGAIAYTLKVSNNGPSAATGVSIVDTLPNGVVFDDANTSPGWTCAYDSINNKVTCDLIAASLANGATAPDLVLHTTAPNQTAAKLTNNATVSANETDTNGANNTASADVTVENADLAITKSASADKVFTGGSLSYTLTVTNNGPDLASNVVVIDNLPDGVSNVTADGNGWNCNYNDVANQVTCTRSSLASGAPADDITIQLTAPSSPGTMDNTASVSSDTLDGNAENNQSSTQVSVLVPLYLPIITNNG